jgi:hypothetical protein
MPRVEVPPRYRVPTRGEAIVEVSATTVRGCIEEAEEKYPGFRKLILDSKGEQKLFVSLFVNGKALARNELETPLLLADSLTIKAAIAGG